MKNKKVKKDDKLTWVVDPKPLRAYIDLHDVTNAWIHTYTEYMDSHRFTTKAINLLLHGRFAFEILAEELITPKYKMLIKGIDIVKDRYYQLLAYTLRDRSFDNEYTMQLLLDSMIANEINNNIILADGYGGGWL